MKCNKCFFCTYIGSGLYAEYPVKYCKYSQEYRIPFVTTKDGTTRKLDFSNIFDLKIWHEAGCNIHPATVAKAKRDFIKSLEAKEGDNKE